MKLIPLLVCLSLLLAAGLILIPTQAQATTLPAISVSGTHITLGGVNAGSTLIGMDDTTVLANAMLYRCEGQLSALGDNMNFPSPTTGSYTAHLEVTNITQTWYSFFWFVAHYDLSWVRLQNGDSWASGVMYQAWKNHPTQYYEVLDAMLKQAYLRGVYVSITLAGSQWDAYNFGGTGSVFTHSHVANSAYDNYFKYVSATIQHCDASPYTNAIFSYDTFNEPDCDHIKTTLWNGDKSAFHAWACAVANDTTPLTTHIVEMGVASHGTFFGFNQADFNLATGQVGFDLCHYHTYFSVEYVPGITWPNSWANAVNKPLNIGEIAKNTNSAPWTYSVWPWFQATAIANDLAAFAWMYLTGTSGYPYTGNYPIAETPAPPTPESLNALITCDHNYGQTSYTVHFSSLVTGGITPYTYSWHFGDGVSSSSANPSHTYTTAGTYSAYLTVTCSGDSDISNAITVRTYAPASPPPAVPPVPPVIPNPGPITEGSNYTYANATGNGSLDETMEVFSTMLPIAVLISLLSVIVMSVARRP